MGWSDEEIVLFIREYGSKKWVLYSLIVVGTLHGGLLYVRKFEPKLRKALGGFGARYRRPTAIIFCLLHLSAVFSAFVCAVACFYSYVLFTLFCLAMCTTALLNGAARYNYYLVDACERPALDPRTSGL